MIFLVRHAHADYTPDEMRGLSEAGRAAALRVAGLLERERVTAAEGARERNVVVASHGNALALFLRTIDPDVDFAFWAQMTFPAVFAVDVNSDRWSYRRCPPGG